MGGFGFVGHINLCWHKWVRLNHVGICFLTDSLTNIVVKQNDRSDNKPNI